MKKKTIKAVIFLLFFAILFYIVFNLLWLYPTPISTFYDEPKDSIDIIYIGSSNVITHFNTTLAYNLYGYKTYNFSTDTQPFALVKHLLKEAKEYQTPSLYVVDLALAAYDSSSFDETGFRKTIDSMKFSNIRTEAINEALSYKKEIKKDEYINWYFSFLMYHNRWKSLKKFDFIGDVNFYKSYLFVDYTTKVNPQESYIWTKDLKPMTEESKEILLNLIDYIKTNNLNVLFVIPPRYFEEEKVMQLNDVTRILQENSFNVINFNTLEDFKVDFSTDFYNEAHLNVKGATKYTLYFSKYLKENYELKDKKGGNQENDLWNREYERFKKDYKKLTNQNFEELLEEINTK